MLHTNERDSNESSNVRDFFKRPENEDTLHYLKRQHQEQMKRMDELDASPIVSPLLNKNRSSNIPVTSNTSDKNNNGQADLLRQQLRGEIPLPSSAMSSSSVFPNNISNNRKRNEIINNSNFQYSFNDSRVPNNTNSHNSYISSNTNDNVREYRNNWDKSSWIQMNSLIKETESLRDIVYQQQRDMRTMNILLDNERNKNTHLYDRLNQLEDKLQMMEMNSRLPLQRSYEMINNQSRLTSSRNNSNNPNMYYDSYPPSSNHSMNTNNNHNNNHNNGNQEINQPYRNQEFISSPTTATTNHPFSIVDDKTTNLLFSKKAT